MASSIVHDTTSATSEEPSSRTLNRPNGITKPQRQPRGPPADDNQPHFQKRERILVDSCYIACTGIIPPTDIDPRFQQFLASSWRHPKPLPSSPALPTEPLTPPPLPSAPPPSPAHALTFHELAKSRSSATSRWASEVQEEVFVYTPNEDTLVETLREEVNTIPVPDRSTSSSRWASVAPIEPAPAPAPTTNGFSIKGLAARKAVSIRTVTEVDDVSTHTSETGWGHTSEPSLTNDDTTTTTSEERSFSPKGKERGRQTPKFRRPTSDASTLKPRKAQSSFTVDTSLSQAHSIYSSISRNMEMDPISSHAGMRYEGDLATLGFHEIRAASGGPGLPKMPVPVVDAKIKQHRAQTRQDRIKKLRAKGLSNEAIEAALAREEVNKRDHALDRPLYAEKKLLAKIVETSAEQEREDSRWKNDGSTSSSESEEDEQVGSRQDEGATPKKPARSSSSSRSSGSEYETGWGEADLDSVSPPRSPISSPQCDGWEKMPVSKINGGAAVETGWGDVTPSNGVNGSSATEEEEEW